jgi:hypothetical protein
MPTPIFGYPALYANNLNSTSQIRRSTDMVYQRGGTYEIVLTGDTYQSSIEMDVDLYANGDKVGRMSLVPYSTIQSGSTYTYKFNLRPYSYLSNYVQSEHYTSYKKNDWINSDNMINLQNPYPNSVQANFKYGYRYVNSTGATVTEYITEPVKSYNHFTYIPFCISGTTFLSSGYTNTGDKFDYVGGAFQMGDDKFYLPNFDQEIGTTIETGLTISPASLYRRPSPMSQYLMDYPTLPDPSQTARFLTDAPRIQNIQSDENYVLYYLNGQTGDRQVIQADFVMIQLFNTSGIRTTITQPLNFSGTDFASPTGFTDTLQIFALPCGPADITNIFSAITWSNIEYYTVQIMYGYPTDYETRNTIGIIGPTSESFTFQIVENCKPENTRLAFLNARGGFDYFTFTTYRQDTKKIKSQTFDSRYYSTSLESPDRDYGRSVKTFATDIDQEIVLESDYLSNAVGNWLEQLFYSPQVYEMKADYLSPIDTQNIYFKDLQPLQVLSTEVQTITKKHQKLNKYRITLKTADTFFVNRGF